MIDVLGPGTLVDVRCHFTRAWASGFEVDRALLQCGAVVYELRRLSDGRVLPAWFVERDVRPTWSVDRADTPGPLGQRMQAPDPGLRGALRTVRSSSSANA